LIEPVQARCILGKNLWVYRRHLSRARLHHCREGDVLISAMYGPEATGALQGAPLGAEKAMVAIVTTDRPNHLRAAGASH
jgi:hypothetical protein